MEITCDDAGLARLVRDLSAGQAWLVNLKLQPGKIHPNTVVRDEFWVHLTKKQVEHLERKYLKGRFAELYGPEG